MQSKDGEDHEDKKPDVSMDDISNDEIVESDVELDDSVVVEPDNDPPHKVGSSKKIKIKNQIPYNPIYLLCICLHYYRWVTLLLK